MSPFVFRFSSRWLIHAQARHIYELLTDPAGFPRWMPDVCPAARELDPVEGRRRVKLLVQGFLPYALELDTLIDEYPDTLTIHIRSSGELVGRGLWKIIPRRDAAVVAFACSVEVGNPWMRLAAIIARPIFSANHSWVMACVHRDLEKELKRRQTTDSVESSIKAPISAHSAANKAR